MYLIPEEWEEIVICPFCKFPLIPLAGTPVLTDARYELHVVCSVCDAEMDVVMTLAKDPDMKKVEKYNPPKKEAEDADG